MALPVIRYCPYRLYLDGLFIRIEIYAAIFADKKRPGVSDGIFGVVV
ncbi:hypothetical protein [Neisseria cinerea]|nr:hypothetical protein [Neisseria cinerea]